MDLIKCDNSNCKSEEFFYLPVIKIAAVNQKRYEQTGYFKDRSITYPPDYPQNKLVCFKCGKLFNEDKYFVLLDSKHIANNLVSALVKDEEPDRTIPPIEFVSQAEEEYLERAKKNSEPAVEPKIDMEKVIKVEPDYIKENKDKPE